MSVRVALIWGAAAACLSVLSACGAPPQDGEGDVEEAAAKPPAHHVVVTAEQRKRLGVRVAALAAATYEEQVQGFGVAVRFDELAQAAAEVETAQAAARQSASALTRAKRLNDAHYASGEVLDAAQKQAATDEAQLALAQRKESVTFGRDAPWRTSAERQAVLAKLARGEMSLVRVTFPSDSVGAALPATVDVQRLSAEAGRPLVRADEVWAAPADATMPGRSYFVLIKGGAVAEGERLLAFAATGGTLAGVIVPSTALVMSEGQTWCYVDEGKGSFERRAVETKRPAGDGYFVSAGFKPGETVVTHSQSLLLAYEINPEGGEEDED